MKIKTITCHDVYNVGASLQAYALQQHLAQQGHDVEIIDYKPDYLSRHYSLTAVNNPLFDRAIIRQAYLLAKLPGRLLALRSERKRNFDRFRSEKLMLTPQRYTSNAQLKAQPPQADVYIAGSDQIWNPLFPNGKDAAFFLDFVPEGKRRISYAASFAVDEIAQEDQQRMTPWLKKLDAVSVREASGVRLLEAMGLYGEQVCDPVFLLDRAHWQTMVTETSSGIFVYDFDGSEQIRSMAQKLSVQRKAEIVSVFPMKGAERVCTQMGPQEFVSAIANAGVVLSNSFHATAFALIFQREFFVVERSEKINTRMRDLLESLGLQDRLIRSPEEMDRAKPVDWRKVEAALNEQMEKSKEYLKKQTMDAV